MFSKIKYILALIVLSLIAHACASYGSLAGGEKDITPPEIVESKPVNGSTNFTGKKIQITFNEFIQLKDLQKQFVVSPPMKIAPIVVPKPKDIIVNFEETLKPNTTYTLDFGNSIADFNEGNPFRKFDFVFSTGDHIDSLSILGKVLNAVDHTPEKDGMFVMLYPLSHDSIPRKTLPAFLAKTDEKGWFKINHVYADTFMIFGLKDMNMNYLFDQPGEQIAFSDTLIIFDTTYFDRPDTSTHKLKVLKLPKDTTKLDSTDFYAGKTPKIELFFFKENYRKQSLNSYNRPKNNLFTLIFELPELDSIGLKLLNVETTSNWWQKDILLPNDTIDYWITDTAVIKMDTLQVQVGYYRVDSAEMNFLKYDTIKLITKRNPALKNRKAEQQKKPSRITVHSSLSSNPTLELNQKVYIEPDQPIKIFDQSKIHLTRLDDTLKVPVKFTIQKDTVLLRRYYILFNYLSDTEYTLLVDSFTYTNLFDIPSDSTGFSFKTRRDDYYGTIKLTLKNLSCPTIVQLVNPKGELIKEKNVKSDGSILFDYLEQGKYSLKLIYDVNKNGKWDTGNWGKRIQPEKTVFYNKEISVRSSWDIEVLWNLIP